MINKDDNPTIDGSGIIPEELQIPTLATKDETNEEVKEVVSEEEISKEDLNKKNYHKISPTFYVQPFSDEEQGDDDLELFKILNPETDLVEKRELTDEEKHEIFVHELKESRIKFNPIKHPTKTIGITTETDVLGRTRIVKEKGVASNIKINKFNTAYKQKRKRKNKLAKTSRKANRKK